MTDDPAFDSEDPPLPGEEPTKAMEGEPPIEPMAGGERIQMNPDEKVPRQAEAAAAWHALVGMRHHPTCAVVLFFQTREQQDEPIPFPIPPCTCGADVVNL